VTLEVALAFGEAEVFLAHGRRILGPVSLEIRRGERWAVLGPNGAGKTTLLQLAGARRQPSRGRVEVLGSVLGRVDVRQLRRRIGHVGQSLADRLRGSMPAREVVLTGAGSVLESWWLEPTDAERGRAEELLALVGCAALAAQPYATCSQGERQRLLVARALMGSPDLLLFDEPAAGLDLPGREALLGALDIASEGATASILVTHHVEELPAGTTNAALLRDGELTAAGPVDEVLTDAAMSACFGIGVRIARREGRWSAVASSPLVP
jgi:iron complex transport system ATP-binding protein